MTNLVGEQREREVALDAALRLTVGREDLSGCDVIDLAEYIRTGARGLPLTESAAPQPLTLLA